MAIRDRAPLRLTVDVETPGGRHYRWAEDETEPEQVFSGLSFSSTIPGGFESLGLTLPRKPQIDYADLEPLSTITVRDAGGEIVGQYRLEATPRTSGDQMAFTPSAAGWQAHLEDDKSAQEIYIDRDLGRWGGMTREARLLYLSFNLTVGEGQTETAAATGDPTIKMLIEGPWLGQAIVDSTYDAGEIGIGTIYWTRTSDANLVSQPDASFIFTAGSSTDGIAFVSTSGDMHTGVADGEVAASVTVASATDRYGLIRWQYGSAAGTAGGQYFSTIEDLIVVGRHGLTLQGTFPAYGLFASDVISHAVSTYAPRLQTTDDSIEGTGFVIPQLAFTDPTTAAEIVSAANRFELNDWAVWNGPGERPTFYYYARGSRGRRWRTRIRPSQLAEHGGDVQRIWNGVIVRYNDVDGTSLSVGPPGSGANAESTDCEDSAPQNPANAAGIRKWDLLDMGGVSTPAGAQEVGRRFLLEANRLDTSGQAQLVGHVEDDRGVVHPASHVRAGDYIMAVDAAYPGYRRIVKANYDHDSRTTSVDLDAPPDALATLLERLQVVLVPLGL